MAKTSLILTSTEQTTGKTLQKTITDVNPDASSEALLGFAQRLNALTTNVYGKTDRIDKVNVDTESTAGLLTPTLSIAKTTYSWSGDKNNSENVTIDYTYDGDGNIYINPSPAQHFNATINRYGSGGRIYIGRSTIEEAFPWEFTVNATQSDTYKAATPVAITITA